MPSLVTSTVPVGSLAAVPQPTLAAGRGVLLRPWSLGDGQAVMDARSRRLEAPEVRGRHDRRRLLDRPGRVAGKTGFAAEGVRRSAWLLADGRHDVHAHARLRP
jgi:hypothetical protein